MSLEVTFHTVCKWSSSNTNVEWVILAPLYSSIFFERSKSRLPQSLLFAKDVLESTILFTCCNYDFKILKAKCNRQFSRSAKSSQDTRLVFVLICNDLLHSHPPPYLNTSVFFFRLMPQIRPRSLLRMQWVWQWCYWPALTRETSLSELDFTLIMSTLIQNWPRTCQQSLYLRRYGLLFFNKKCYVVAEKRSNQMCWDLLD